MLTNPPKAEIETSSPEADGTIRPLWTDGSPDLAWVLAGTGELGRRLKQEFVSHRASLQTVSVLVLINLVVASLAFVTRVKIANVLGRADFGLFSYGLALAAYGVAIVQFGLDRTLVRDLVHWPARTGPIVAASIVLRGGVLLALAAALLLWKSTRMGRNDVSWGLLLIIFGGSIVALDLRSVYDTWGNMIRHAMYYLVSRMLFFCPIWLMLVWAPGGLSIFWIGVFTVGSALVYLWLQYMWAFRRIDFSQAKGGLRARVMALGRANVTIWVSSVVGLVVVTANQILLKVMGGKEELGTYAAAWVVVALASLFLAQISRIGTPASARVTRRDVGRTERVRFLLKYSAVALVCISPISVLAIFFPTVVVRTFYSAEYASAAPVLQILGAYLVVYSVAMVPAQYVVACRRELHYLVNVLCGGVANILLCLFLIPRYTATGAAVALLISHGLTTGLNYATSVAITVGGKTWQEQV